MVNRLTPIPLPVILAAIDGDSSAISSVIAHYQSFIKALSTKKVRDEFGNEYTLIDETMRIQLETKLVQSILTGFKILPA